ncbi:MAG: response regulator transcription factor [Chloroflexi bacterium]|nr:MAG: response regulator transcription factor [Chloroflexota bacterium]
MNAPARGTVLIVEDSSESAALLVELVEGEGFAVEVCGTAAEALDAFQRIRPVAVLLDWGLPDNPGPEVCRTIRGLDSAVPIVFVSGRNDETSMARALEAGADDYVPKPVRPGELMARLEAHLRRVAALRNGSHEPAGVAPKARNAQIGLVEVDLIAREVRKAGRPVKIGPLEFKLLEYLLANAGAAVSRDQILSEVYGYEADISSERVDVLVRRLRSKLGEGETGELIAAVPGYGYRLDRRAGR